MPRTWHHTCVIASVSTRDKAINSSNASALCHYYLLDTLRDSLLSSTSKVYINPRIVALTIQLVLLDPTSCHDPSHGGSYMAEGAFGIRIGLPPRVVLGDCLVTSCIRLVMDWLVVPFIVAAHIRCLVIGVVLVRIVDPSMFLSRLCGPGGYPYLHMSVRFHGSLYPMTDFTLRVWYGLFTPMSVDVPWGSSRFYYW